MGTVIILLIIVSFLSCDGFADGRNASKFDQAEVEKEVTAGVLYGSTPSEFSRTSLQQKMTDDGAARRITITDMLCPASPSMTEGTTFSCIAKAEDGSPASTNVRLVDTAGRMTWIFFDKLGVEQEIIDDAMDEGPDQSRVHRVTEHGQRRRVIMRLYGRRRLNGKSKRHMDRRCWEPNRGDQITVLSRQRQFGSIDRSPAYDHSGRHRRNHR